MFTGNTGFTGDTVFTSDKSKQTTWLTGLSEQLCFESDFASLCALGFPLSLGVQLQQSCLKLSEAHWTVRSTSGGFSVSFFWPASENVKVQLKKKRKRRYRGKIKAQSATATPPKENATIEPSTSSAIDKSPQTMTPDGTWQVVRGAQRHKFPK